MNILIGTHRILGKDVKFKDLGLLIIDEEQKFGVSVKEKLRQLKVNVDTLTIDGYTHSPYLAVFADGCARLERHPDTAA